MLIADTCGGELAASSCSQEEEEEDFEWQVEQQLPNEEEEVRAYNSQGRCLNRTIHPAIGVA